MFAGAATVFTVRDIAASVAYYRDVLGFDMTDPDGNAIAFGMESKAAQ
jgi:catechol 2,3-dioxygenase-like lactoylglutathione lyase family enzyme